MPSFSPPVDHVFGHPGLVDRFKNNLAFRIVSRNELQKLQSNLARAFAPRHFGRPQPHQDGFQSAHFADKSVFDNLERLPEQSIDNFNHGDRRSAFLGTRVSGLSLFPPGFFRGTTVADRVGVVRSVQLTLRSFLTLAKN